jgi:hypothetical protein
MSKLLARTAVDDRVRPIGERQLISAADALLLAQVSSFHLPDLSEPPLDFNDDGQSNPFRPVSSSSTCLARAG